MLKFALHFVQIISSEIEKCDATDSNEIQHNLRLHYIPAHLRLCFN